MQKNIGKILTVLCSTAIICAALVGCGKKESEELESYKEQMTGFYDKLAYYDRSINTIDPDSETAKDELLEYLDEMNSSYYSMASYDIPEEFTGISDIAVEAADYMQKAQEYYHMAFDGSYDENSKSLADQYYERANSRAMVILQVLHGEVPTGEGVIVTTQEPGQFDTVSEDED
jgi:hypothetical protein